MESDVKGEMASSRAAQETESSLRRAQSVARIGKWWYELDTQRVRWTDEMFRVLGMTPRSFAMPGMTGLELTGALKRIRSDIPVILCTGYSHQVNESVAKTAGVSAFVPKPFNRNDIATLIKKEIEQKT